MMPNRRARRAPHARLVERTASVAPIAALATLVVASLAAHAGCSTDDRAADPPSDGGTRDDAIDVAAAADDAAPDDAAPDDAADAHPLIEAPIDCATDDAGDGVPRDLACTGLYAAWPDKAIAADVRAYAPGYVLWSDGAIKSRYIQLPAGATIDSSDMNEWTFPVGTKLWKEFVVGGRRVETRLLWKRAPSQWSFVVYRWSDDESRAERFDAGATNVVGTYEIPPVTACPRCHGGRKDQVLGFEAVGLSGARATGLTMSALVAQGLLTAPPASTITIPEDASGKAREAIGWLHANCGTACHNPNASAQASTTGLWLRVDAARLASADGGATAVKDLDAYATAVGVPPKVLTRFTGYTRIAKNDVAHSLIPLVDESRGGDGSDGGVPQMPPLATHVPDTDGVALVKGWITAMP